MKKSISLNLTSKANITTFNLFLVFIFLITPILSIGQTEFFDYTVKPPDVASLFEVKNPSINESRGKPNISIPLYSIDIGNLQIPITLNYNLGGTKVEYESSWVGNSWALSSHGVISRKLMGRVDEFDDFALSWGPGYNTSTGYNLYPPCNLLMVYEDLGWFINADAVLAKSNYYKQNNGSLSGYNGPTATAYADNSPDIFYYTLPNGISGSFLFKNENTIINSGKEVISYELNASGQISEFEIIDAYGNRFLFEEFSVNGNDFNETFQYTYNSNATKPSFSPLFSYPDIPCEEGDYPDYSNSEDGSIALYNRSYTDNWYLTKIISSSTNNEISYTYSDSNHASLLNTRNSTEGSISSSNALNYIETKVISSIEWKSGKIDFITKSTVREDVIPYSIHNRTSELKALDKINIYDKDDILKKRITFLTSYNEAENIENETNANYEYIYKRLWLDGITINDFSSSPLIYNFVYNQTKLPPRLSFEQDYWGYYNGNGADTDNKYFIPKLWFYPDDVRSYTRQSSLSIAQRSSYQGQEQVYGSTFGSDRTSNINFSKAGVLEEIIYPTGGKVKFEYELNSFLIEDQVIEGAGLRVEKVTSDPIDGEDIIDNYSYTDQQSITTGKITEFPLYGSLVSVIGSQRKYFVNSGVLDNDVYYSKVEKIKTGNGKVVSTFLIPFSLETEQSMFSNVHQDYFYEKNFDISVFLIQTGITTYGANTYDYGRQPTSLNYENIFGRVLSKEVFDENGTSLEKNEYSYDFTEKSERVFHLSSSINGIKLNTVFIGDLVQITNQSSKYYSSSTSIVTNEEYEYDEYGQISKSTFLDSSNEHVIKEFKYPYDESSTVLDALVSLNTISTPIETKTYRKVGTAEELLSTERTEYKDWGNNLILPEFTQNSKGSNTLENTSIIDRRDVNGNILQYHKIDGIYVSIIWGHDKTVPIAKVENATYATIEALTGFGNNFDIPDNLPAYKETHIRSIPNALVTTYQYEPLVGVTKITDNKKYSTLYEYDEFNRLKRVKDSDGRILSENEYHFKN